MADSIPKLGEHLGEYDLLITHYGITAFEALYTGTPVLLLSPTAYHEKLAKAAGFHALGIGPYRAVRLGRLLLSGNSLNRVFLAELKTRCTSLAARYYLDHTPRQNLAELINSFTPLVSRACRVCGSNNVQPLVFRYAERNYRRCKDCGALSMNRLSRPPIEYAREYFFEFYQKQYGKTYIEDFPNLSAMAKQRLAIIGKLLLHGAGQESVSASGDNRRLLLDIGCAYGPFLAAAKAEGFAPYGIDPAEDAVRYVTQTLGIPAIQGFFPQNPLPVSGGGEPVFSAVTLWYVIEHFHDCVPVLSAIRKILKPGGVLAFSTPSYRGISGRSSLGRLLKKSPADHWTIWSPIVCRRALAHAGFTVKKIVISGHHPERFPLLGRFARPKNSLLCAILLAVSRIFALGDTFEVYAVSTVKNDKKSTKIGK